MEKKPTPSNTKAEILDAYDELLKKLDGQKNLQPKDILEKEEQDKTLKMASKINKEGVINQIASLKISLDAQLEKVEESLITESRNLAKVEEAIKIQEQRLEELYGINATSDSLAAMITLQKEKKEAFENEMEQKKVAFELEVKENRVRWEKEKKEAEQVDKEEKERLQKQRKREEEEYAYTLKLTRKKEADLYEQKSEMLEKELAQKTTKFEQEITVREQAVMANESELSDLRQKSTSFPVEMEKAIKKAVADNTQMQEHAYKFESQLKSMEYASDVKLKDQEIANLKTRIKDLEQLLTQQITKAEMAEKNSKDIAMKAIENANNYKYFERAKEQKEEK